MPKKPIGELIGYPGFPKKKLEDQPEDQLEPTEEEIQKKKFEKLRQLLNQD